MKAGVGLIYWMLKADIFGLKLLIAEVFQFFFLSVFSRISLRLHFVGKISETVIRLN